MIKSKFGVTIEYKYEEIIIEADEFFEGADVLLWGWGRNIFSHPLLFPSIVSYSFACELYCKGICQKYFGSFEHGHDIEQLFNRLPQSIAEEVKLKVAEKEFDNKLKKVKNLFQESRYFFDEKYDGKIPDVEFIRRLATALNEVSKRVVKCWFKVKLIEVKESLFEGEVEIIEINR